MSLFQHSYTHSYTLYVSIIFNMTTKTCAELSQIKWNLSKKREKHLTKTIYRENSAFLFYRISIEHSEIQWSAIPNYACKFNEKQAIHKKLIKFTLKSAHLKLWKWTVIIFMWNVKENVRKSAIKTLKSELKHCIIHCTLFRHTQLSMENSTRKSDRSSKV